MKKICKKKWNPIKMFKQKAEKNKNCKDINEETADFLPIIKEYFSEEIFKQYIEINESDFLATRLKIFYITNLKGVLESNIQKPDNYLDSISVFNTNDPCKILQKEIFEKLQEDICWGFKKLESSESILRSSELILTKEGKHFISTMISNLEKIKENCPIDNYNISFNDIISAFSDKDIRFELIIKYLAQSILSLKLKNRLSLPDIRKNLKQGILTNFVMFSLFHDERDKKLKRVKKLIIEFPNLRNEMINQALLNRKIDIVEDYYFNGVLLNINIGSHLVNQLIHSKKFMHDPSNRKDFSLEFNNLLRYISENEDQGNYLKTYFQKISGISQFPDTI